MPLLAAPLLEGQLDFAEDDDLTNNRWGIVDEAAGNGSNAIVIDPASPILGRSVARFETNLGGEANEAGIRIPLRYYVNGDTSFTGSSNACKVMFHIYWNAGYTITNSTQVAVFRILYGGSVSNYSVIVKMEGTSHGTNSVQLNVASNVTAEFAVDDSGCGHDAGDANYYYDINCHNNWITLLVEYEKGSGSDGKLYITWEDGRQSTISRGTALAPGSGEATGNTFTLASFDATQVVSQFSIGVRNQSAFGQSNIYIAGMAWTAGDSLDSIADPSITDHLLEGMVRDVNQTSFGVFCRCAPGSHKHSWYTDAAVRFSVRYKEENEEEYTETDKVDLNADNYWGACLTVTGLSYGTYTAITRIYDTSDDEDYVDTSYELTIPLLTTLSSYKYLVTHCYGEDGEHHPYYAFDYTSYNAILYIDDVGYQDVIYDSDISSTGNTAVTEVRNAYQRGFWHALYDKRLASTNRNTPIYFAYGDHQFVDDMRLSYRTSTGTPPNWTNIRYVDIWTGASLAWANWFRDGMLDLEDDGECYRTIQTNNVALAFCDDVTLRNNTGGSIYGSTQTTYFNYVESNISTKPWYLWCSGKWIQDGVSLYYSDDPAHPNFDDEREAREASWNSNQLNVIITGKDRHYIRVANSTTATAIVYESINGPGSWRQWNVDLTGATSGNAIYHYTAGDTADHHMKAFSILTLTPTNAIIESFKDDSGVISSLGSYSTTKVYIDAAPDYEITDSSMNFPAKGLGLL